MVSYLVLRHMEQRTVTLTELVQVSELPYATAHRRIAEYFEAGRFEKRNVADQQRRFEIVPSKDLLADFVDFARAVKLELVQAGAEHCLPDAELYFLGGEHQANALNVEQTRALKSIEGVEDARFLLHGDNYFRSVRHVWTDHRRRVGTFDNFTLLTLNELHDELVINARLPVSRYSIVAVNVPWLGEFWKSGALLDLKPLLDTQRGLPASFEGQIWDLGSSSGHQCGMPAYATAQVMAARRDWLDKHELKAPATFDDVVRFGKAFHRPGEGRFGIVWSGRAGVDIAQMFLSVVGCCGAPIFDFSQIRGGFEKKDLNAGKLIALIDSYAAVTAIEYMRELLEISAPGVPNFSWQDSLSLFMQGRVAMTYVWSIHATRFEMDIDSTVKRKVTYLQIPAHRKGRSTTPLGGFVLAIPANQPSSRIHTALKILAWMASPDAATARNRDGLPLSPLFSLNGDPAARASHQIYDLVRSLSQKHLLNVWQRPATPEYAKIETILGEEVHRAVFGSKPVKDALVDASRRVRSVAAS